MKRKTFDCDVKYIVSEERGELFTWKVYPHILFDKHKKTDIEFFKGPLTSMQLLSTHTKHVVETKPSGLSPTNVDTYIVNLSL